MRFRPVPVSQVCFVKYRSAGWGGSQQLEVAPLDDVQRKSMLQAVRDRKVDALKPMELRLGIPSGDGYELLHDQMVDWSGSGIYPFREVWPNRYNILTGDYLVDRGEACARYVVDSILGCWGGL